MVVKLDCWDELSISVALKNMEKVLENLYSNFRESVDEQNTTYECLVKNRKS